MSLKSFVREPAVAGQFYPGKKSELKKQLSDLFKRAQQKNTQGTLRAIISPHAGYVFSGEVAASAFNQIPPNKKYKRVFVIASSHRYHFNGAAIYNRGNYRTPLGEIEVDTVLAEKLNNSSDVFLDNLESHENEHSLEVQLPFLQQKIGNDFLLVPIILGTNSADEVKKIANVLSPFFTRENLFIISTDFSHYPAFSDAVEADKKTADAICSNDPEKLLNALEENKEKRIMNLATSLCGWTSVLALLHLTQNKNLHFNEIQYKNSGHAEIYGDKQRVVGYWAIAISEKEEGSFKITEEEQKELLRKARKTIEVQLNTGTRPPVFSSKTNGILNDSAGAFVSVYINGELRGCIGSFEKKEKSLNEVVQKNAASAIKDARFESVNKEELENMELEISVLSPMKKIKIIEEIELGKHGIYIKKGFQRGTFLPQVASKTGWTLNEFLGHCARDKAGIGWDGWKDAEIYTFEAFVFRESELKSA